MPLRDHFRPPFTPKRSWDQVHGGWPMVIVQHLAAKLPTPYFASPGVHIGTRFEVDVATQRDDETEWNSGGDGGTALAVMPMPTSTLKNAFFDQDVYEVKVFDTERDSELVAAIELVSPSNKEKRKEREKFVEKLATLLHAGVCVSIVDIVTTSRASIYADLLDVIGETDPVVGEVPASLAALTLHRRDEGRSPLLDVWYYPLAIGAALPVLPIRLDDDLSVTLELEATYEECCDTLRIR